MIVFWTIVTVIPFLAFVAGCIAFPAKTNALCTQFFASRKAAIALTILGWLWTAYECDTIGIDVFDAILLKSATGGIFVWVLAAVLSYLTIIWMPKNLPSRALMGIFMLMPAEAFKTTRLLTPSVGTFAPVQLLVALIYLYAVIGMYGMFYPWRIEKAVQFILTRKAS